jgi:hypothetical protein
MRFQPANCAPSQHIARVQDMSYIGPWHGLQRRHQIARGEELRTNAMDMDAVDGFFVLVKAQLRRVGLPVGDSVDFVAGAHQRLAERALRPVAKMPADAAQS